jgi:hypothetical protein
MLSVEDGICTWFLNSYYLLRKAKTANVTPAKAGGQGEKTGFPLSRSGKNLCFSLDL